MAVVAVVGAFRTGKSFLLDMFLRYLHYEEVNGQSQNRDNDMEWIYTGLYEKDANLEGNGNESNGDGTNASGFGWKAGKERNTTGIWMWGKYFMRKVNNENVAVFLIDTQGMFDSETSQMLTASIFGLSTLLSSYQIYNVDKRIQEDNLQHLALFTEYGRMALVDGEEEDNDGEENDHDGEEASKKDDVKMDKKKMRPFQRLDFLVRDWQNFDDENDEDTVLQEMEEYLSEILSSRTQKDLADTREQINECFQELSCWLLPHPGFEVTKKNYDGKVSKIRPEFLKLASMYIERIFGKHLSPKMVHGQPVTAPELLNFVKVYVNLFKEATIFPEAKTLLEATAEANNINFQRRSMDTYRTEMDVIAGLKTTYCPENELLDHHEVCHDAALKMFDSGANMGRRSDIAMYRTLLLSELENQKLRYLEANREKDPYKNLEFYIIPAAIVVILVGCRILQDISCHEDIGYDIPVYDCKHVSQTLSHLYWAIIFFMLLVTVMTGSVIMTRAKQFVSIVKATTSTESSSKPKKD